MAEKVLVGMSGGVDSSAAVYLLKDRGYNVTGATLDLIGDGGGHDITDAQHVAYQLGIPHSTIPAAEIFEAAVKRQFVDAYEKGLTPNPCVVCNKHIKFGFMLDWAFEHGFERIATGHYARVEYDAVSGRWLLRKSVDVRKDQSYFLYTLSQEQLSHTYFPLGQFTKEQVRELAAQAKLDCAKRPDSQDICFVPDGDYRAFIERFTGRQFHDGNIVDLEGKVLGRHNGIIGYTTGQRRGLGVSGGRPLYVVRKDIERNEVILGDEKDLYTQRISAGDVNWIAVSPPEAPLHVQAKIRFSQQSVNAVVFPEETGVTVEFEMPQRAATPGQSVVFYQDDIVIGGGIIERIGVMA